jgi:hypothetical protein
MFLAAVKSKISQNQYILKFILIVYGAKFSFLKLHKKH